MTPAVQSGPSAAQSNGAQPHTLRPYQHEGLAAIERELLQVRSTLLVQATGTGKTVEFAERTRRTVMRGGRELILVHRDELVKQALRKCEDAGLYADVEKGKQRASTTAKVVIASVQTLRGARLARWPRDHFAEIVVDEAHHAPAPGYRAILDHFVDAKVLGVTATPIRADGAALGDTFETVAYRYELRQAIADEYLVPITARRVVLDGVDLSAVKSRAGDLATDELAAIMAEERAIRGVVEPLLELTGTRRTVVFGVDVAHAQRLAAELNQRRPGCARAVWGEGFDEDERAELLAAFARGEFQFLCNCALLTEGWDADVECVAIARPTKSVGLYMQMVGRGTRLRGATYAESCARGKRDMLLLAFGAHAGKHRLVAPVDCLVGDLPDDIRAELDRLLGHAARRLEDVLAQATGMVVQQRVDTTAAAKVRWHAEQVDPFIGEPQGDLGEIRPGWDEALATRAQLDALERFGIEAKRLPARFSMADASRLIGRLGARKAAGLCSYLVASRLSSCGLDTRTLSAKRAGDLLAVLRKGRWNAVALIGQPEAGLEFHRRLAAAKQRKIEELERKRLARADGSARTPRTFTDAPSEAGDAV